MAMMAITTSSSISVNADLRTLLAGMWNLWLGEKCEQTTKTKEYPAGSPDVNFFGKYARFEAT